MKKTNKNNSFWNSVKIACESLNISLDTFYVWKNRKQISKAKIVPIYEELKGTSYELSLSQLNSKN